MKAAKLAALELVSQYETREPYELCSLLGIRIFENELTENIKGFYIILKGKPVVFINSEMDDIEKRQVLAHELGHVILHPEENLLFMQEKTRFVTSKFEREADLFAAYLLVDSEELHNVCYDVITIEEFSKVMGINMNQAKLIAEDKDYLLGKKS